MVTYLADINTIEHSNAVGAFGQLLGIIVIGLCVIWGIAMLARRVEAVLMPSIPVIIGAAFIGMLAIGLFIHLGL